MAGVKPPQDLTVNFIKEWIEENSFLVEGRLVDDDDVTILNSWSGIEPHELFKAFQTKELNVVYFSSRYDGDVQGKIIQGSEIPLYIKKGYLINDNDFYLNFPVNTPTLYYIPSLPEPLQEPLIKNTCVICLDEKNYNISDSHHPNRIKVLPCGHTFHKKCIEKVKNKKCPLCSADFITSSNLMLGGFYNKLQKYLQKLN